jgi:hypothetical protein
MAASTLCWKSTVRQGSPSGTFWLGARKSHTTTSIWRSRTAVSIARRIGADRYFEIA